MGLGNCLLLWAYALVFARMNDMELVASRWGRFRWGAILRGEKKKRRYTEYFRETPRMQLWLLRFTMFFLEKEYDPEVKKISPDTKTRFYVFTKPYPSRELFKTLEPFEDEIGNALIHLLTPRLQRKYATLPAPQIGIHIRRGDFKAGNPITTNDFFIKSISTIREAAGEELEVSVFTDADDEEIRDILSLKKIVKSQNQEDILDILQMSKSRFMVLSRSSTFSYWAAFLSEAFVIMSSDDWQKNVKNSGNNYSEFRLHLGKNENSMLEAVREFVFPHHSSDAE